LSPSSCDRESRQTALLQHFARDRKAIFHTEDVVAVGPFGTAAEDPAEIDARRAGGTAPRDRPGRRGQVGPDGRRIEERVRLQRKTASLPRVRDDLRFATCAREQIQGCP